MPSVFDVLRLHEVSGMMAELRTPFDRLQSILGFTPQGPNTVKTMTRSVEMDVANPDRRPAEFSAPGSNATVVAPTVVGSRTHQIPRTFEKRQLDYETLNNIRQIGKSATPTDQAGMAYLELQMQRQKERTDLWREFLCFAFERGSGKFIIKNNNWIPATPGATAATGNVVVTIDWQLPATHKNQLNALLSNWQLKSATPIRDITAVNAQNVTDSGYPLRTVKLNSILWNSILETDEVQDKGGAVNTPFDYWRFQDRARSDGLPDTVQLGKLKGLPWIDFIIIDDVIQLFNGTSYVNTKYYADDEVSFMPEVNKSWAFIYETKETTLQDGGRTQDVVGKADWIRRDLRGDTPTVELFSLDNALPVGNPNAWHFGDVAA